MNDQAEQLRKASELRQERSLGRLRCIAVGSGKGGVGKTMVSVSIGSHLVRMDNRVLLLDADLGLANVDLQMGLNPSLTMQDVLFGDKRLDDVVLSTDIGLDVLSSSSGSSEMVDMGDARRKLFVDELVRFASGYDYLIIDAGAGIGREVITFMCASPEVVVVVANEPTSVMDAYSLIKILHSQAEPPSMMLVINLVRSLAEGDELAERLNAITKRFLGLSLPVAGTVLYDDIIGDAIRAQSPLIKYAAKSAPSQCLKEVAKFIVAQDKWLGSKRRSKDKFFDKLADLGVSKEKGGKP